MSTGLGRGLLLIALAAQAPEPGGARATEMTVIAASDGALELGSAASWGRLHAQDGAPRALAAPRLSLVLRDLRAPEPPGVLYYVYLGVAEGAREADERLRVGILNFYGVPSDDAAARHSAAAAWRSFEVPEAARERLHAGEWGVLIRPSAPGHAGRASIGRLELIAQ